MSTDSGACPPFPDAFVRLRYFFGKRLGVADLRDEQAYHHGKMRFHNRHLHGSGVVCGLRIAPFDSLDVDNTVLRVGRGAALDSCGNEVLVSHDQCIDLSAWFRRAAEELEGSGEAFPPTGAVVDGVLPVCIALRYRECPTTPEAAPRDPCNTCDTGGLEYGRVQEGFELRVLLPEESVGLDAALVHPSPELLDQALSESSTAEELHAALGHAVSEGCAEAREPDWILLGCLGLVLDEEGLPRALTEAGTWSGPSSFLLSTAALQRLLLQRLVEGSAVEVSAAAASEASELPLSLLTDETPSLRMDLAEPIEAATLNAGAVELRRLGGRSAWVEARLGVTQSEDERGPFLTVEVNSPRAFLKEGRFQLRVGHQRTVVTEGFALVHRDIFFELGSGPEGLILTRAVDHGRSA
ncbi:MAG: hypothetical protein ACI9VR_005344 [Cognaticolwellia sp.]|jgi:hypothetical protein